MKPKTIWNKQSWYDKWSIWYRLFNSFDKNGFRRVGIYSQFKNFIPYTYTPIADAKFAQISFNFRNMQEKALSGVMVMYITVSRKITLK